ncbi:protein kinase superfamily protein [Wolffia australiana]
MVAAAALSAGIAAGAILSGIIMLSMCWRRRHCKKAQRERSEPEKGQITARVADGPDFTEEEDDVNSVKRFTWAEIERMTENFSTPVIGEGGYSKVYLARLRGGAVVAVKIHINGGGSVRLRRAFTRELDLLRRVRHPHVIRIIGFCDDREEGALVMEYAARGTLHEKLHLTDSQQVLSWSARTRIALQIAQVVDHLHNECGLPIIHCDLKPSNVLLDEQLNVKLCDFGSAMSGFGPTISANPKSAMEGSPGYVDPHYIRTGVLSKNCDVYSFGVLLLELISGVEVSTADKTKLLEEDLVDSRLRGDFDGEETAAMLVLARRCMAEQPSSRPSMAEIVGAIGRLRTAEELVISVEKSVV